MGNDHYCLDALSTSHVCFFVNTLSDEWLRWCRLFRNQCKSDKSCDRLSSTTRSLRAVRRAGDWLPESSWDQTNNTERNIPRHLSKRIQPPNYNVIKGKSKTVSKEKLIQTFQKVPKPQPWATNADTTVLVFIALSLQQPYYIMNHFRKRLGAALCKGDVFLSTSVKFWKIWWILGAAQSIKVNPALRDVTVDAIAKETE